MALGVARFARKKFRGKAQLGKGLFPFVFAINAKQKVGIGIDMQPAIGKNLVFKLPAANITGTDNKNENRAET